VKSQAEKKQSITEHKAVSGVLVLFSILIMFIADMALIFHLFPSALDTASTLRLAAGEIGLAALAFVLVLPLQAIVFSLYRFLLRSGNHPLLALLQLCSPLAGLGFLLGTHIFSGPAARNMAIAPFAPYAGALLLLAGFWVLLVFSRWVLARSRYVVVFSGITAMTAALGLLVTNHLIFPGLYHPIHWLQQALALILIQISLTALFPALRQGSLRSNITTWAIALPIAFLISFPATRWPVAPALSQFVNWGSVSRYAAESILSIWPDSVASDFLCYLAGMPEEESMPDPYIPTPPDQLQQFKSKLPQGKLNFMLVVVDALRADQLAAFDPQKHQTSLTPALDAFARQSFRFLNTVSQSSGTEYSIPSLFSSQIPVIDSEMRFPTFMSLFNRIGYHTFGALPQYFHLIDLKYVKFMNEGFGRVEYTEKTNRVEFETSTMELLKKETQNPFFAYIHFYQLHSDYYTPPGYTSKYPGFSRLSRYDKATLYADEVFGRMIEQMRSQGLLENTVIVVTADHGEAFMEHGQKMHSTSCYREQVRVPMMVYIPEFSGGETEAQVGNLDILPTVAEIFDLPERQHFLGRSLIPLMMGEDNQRDRIYFTRAIGNRARAVMDERYKLIYASRTLQLFDLENDPGELQNIYTPDSMVARQLTLELYLTFPDIWKKMLGKLDVTTFKRGLDLLRKAKSPRARQMAAIMLNLHQRKQKILYTKELIHLYKEEKSPQVRITLAGMLSKIPGKSSSKALEQRFNQSHGRERYETALALSMQMSAKYDRLFLQLMGDAREDLALRRLAANAVQNKSDNDNLAAYLSLTESGQPSDLRIVAIKALHGTGGNQIELQLQRLLDDPDYKVRYAAAESLGYYTSSMDLLLQRYQTESHPLVRRGLLVSIAQVHAPQAFSLCEEALSDRMMVAPAIYGFARLGDQRAIPLLEKLAETYDNHWTQELARDTAKQLKEVKPPSNNK